MDPVLKLAVDIANAEAIKKLTADLDAQKMSVERLNAMLKSTAITQAEYTRWVSNLAPAIQRTSAELKSLEHQSFNASRSLLQASYALDDLQYGFRAIVNNIPQALMFLGPGIAGAAGVAAVAINQLITHWGQLTSAFESFTTGKPMAELEALRLKAESASESFDKLTKAKTRAQQGEEATVEGGIVEHGAGKTFGALVGAIMADTSLLPEEKGTPGTGGGAFAAPGVIPTAPGPTGGEKRQAKAQEMAKRIMGGGAKPGAEQAMYDQIRNRAIQEAYMAKQPSAYDHSFEDRQTAKQLAIEKEAIHLRLQADKKDAELTKRLNEQGKANELAGKQGQFEEAKRIRLQILEDAAEKIQRSRHGDRGQILGGAKAALDYYQNAANANERIIRQLQNIHDEQKRIRRLDFKRAGGLGIL